MEVENIKIRRKKAQYKVLQSKYIEIHNHIEILEHEAT